VKAATVSAHKGGMLSWLFQRITAVLVIICLAIHLILTHLANIGNLNYDTVGHRLAHGTVTAMDIILLAAALFHALNGLRMVLMDYWFTSRGRALSLTLGLWVVGLAFLVYGIWALWPWIS
jgi:succinate dehydrogenase hydrophobic membrane anchor protein